MKEEILGKTGKDIITGFKGIITGHCRYITGCDQYMLQPKTDNGGRHVEARWFDENRVKTMKAKVVYVPTNKANVKANGPCEPAPIK